MSITVSGPQPRSGLAGDSIAIVLTYFLTAAAGMLFWIVAAGRYLLTNSVCRQRSSP